MKVGAEMRTACKFCNRKGDHMEAIEITGYLRSFYTRTSLLSPRKLCYANSAETVLSPSIVLYGPIPLSSLMHNLCVEDEGGTDLVGSLVELLGIKGGSETKGDTRAEEDIVGDGGNTTVVDLDLFSCISEAQFQFQIGCIYLGE